MAQKIEVKLIDDIDGGPAQETVRFSIDGVEIEVDLTNENADRLRAALAPFVAVGRRGGLKSVSSAGSRREDLAKIRAWGRKNGFDVSDRGRVAETVKSAYWKAHSSGRTAA